MFCQTELIARCSESKLSSEGYFEFVQDIVEQATVIECALPGRPLAEGLRHYAGATKERIQFGRPIASFQAMQHKAADIVTEVDGALHTYRTACKQRLIEREIHIEGAFGLGKELHGLRRTRFKGRRRVQIQVWLTAAAMNIMKVVKKVNRTPDQASYRLLLALLRLWATALRPFPVRSAQI